MSKKSNKKDSLLKAKEAGFNLNSMNNVKLPEYNSLHDVNMRHYFENPKLQRILYETGQIDRHGRVIEFERNKSKLHILDREFKTAEEIERKRIDDEMEMRVQ